MAARKLQTEIDRTLKKVAEGIELFESIYDKMQASTNQTQKEKLETDLKTQIKKLQRMRDQIKTWVASNDIKDKSALLENRRLIEMQMEKFKACEKEMKTKAFSKEGLIQSAKLDPEQQRKLEAAGWLATCVEELTLQVETAEAEIESLQVGGRKKSKVGSSTAERLEELERLNERRKWHISRLEIMLRLLDNGTLTADRVLGLKEDVDYFVESNPNDDFEEDEGLYDELNLDEEEEKFGRLIVDEQESDSDEASEDLPPRTPSKKHDEESVTSSSKRDESPIMKKAGVTLQLRKHSSAADAPKPPPNPNFAQQPMASILKAGLPTPQSRPPAPQLPPIQYATAAAAAVTPSTSQTSNGSAPPPSATTSTQAPSAAATSPKVSTLPASSTSATQDSTNAGTSSPSLTHLSTTSPMLSSAISAQQGDDSFSSPALSDAVSGAPGASPSSPGRQVVEVESPQVRTQSPAAAVSAAPPPPRAARDVTPQQALEQANGAWPAQGPSSLPQQVQSGSGSSAASPLPSTQAQAQQPQFPPGVKVPETQPPRAPSAGASAFPGSLSDLVASFETVKQKAAHRMANLDQVHKYLESGYANLPQPQDTEKPKYYVPRNPFQTPSYYPQTTNPILSSPGLFAQLDVETLFYVFYFLPGTYQQYLAAKELKRQSWRFHVKYLTWFQRHSEPQAITDEYEQGVYVYFDWEGSWCQRKKSDFRFEYRYLSED